MSSSTRGVLGAMGVPADEPHPGETPKIGSVADEEGGSESADAQWSSSSATSGHDHDDDHQRRRGTPVTRHPPTNGDVYDDEQWELLKALQVPGYVEERRRCEAAARDMFTPLTAAENEAAVEMKAIRDAAALAEVADAEASLVPAKTAGSLRVLNPTDVSANLCKVGGSTSQAFADSVALVQRAIDTSKWEELLAVVDSGATVPVLHPKTGRAYQLEESPASRAGVEYELADASTLANLGQKRMAVLTEEATLRGYSSQCAEVSKALNSVRTMVGSKHAVCFGLGPEGEDHLIINHVTGEVNRMIDDGMNYLQKLFIIPPDQINAVRQRLEEMGQGGSVQSEDFHRPGR